MTPAVELLHLLCFAFFIGCAYQALTRGVKRRFATFVMSVLLALPFYFVLTATPSNLSLPSYPWCAVLPLSVGMIEALRVTPKRRRR
jgi:hypothetical protein